MAAAKSDKKYAVAPTTNSKTQNPKKHSEKEREDILKAIDAISDDDDDENRSVDEDSDADDNDDGEEWDREAMALRKMISDGKFHELLKRHDAEKKKKEKGENIMEDDAEEDEIDDAEEDEIDDDDVNDSEQDEEEGNNNEDDDDKDEAGSDDDDEEDEKKLRASNAQETRAKALISAIQSSDRNLPFAESFAIVPPTPLPFGPKIASNNNPEDGEEGAQPVDIHDDLKREVAFYDTALEAVHLAREQCEKAGIPFQRPEDFFAEMVKTDEHMAKVKDRLIFETKKIEAVQRRKSNKEQTLMAKERHAHRLAEKAKAKKEHMASVEEWKKNAERSRGGLGGKVVDVEEEEERLRGVGKKRAAADRRYGFGGKRGRFKQNDRKTLDDMSGFKPRGGFGGVGQKTVAGGSKKKMGGKKRVGKRARDAARSGRK